MRLLPGMQGQQIRYDIRALIEPIAAQHQVQFTFTPLFAGAEAFANDNGELLRVCEQLTGHSGQSVAFGTEAPFLQQLNMDTVVLGPGEAAMAHQTDEYCHVERIRQSVDLYEQLIKDWIRK